MGYRVKIYYHHTDCGGVVYYANYLKLLEEARTEFLAENGISVEDFIRKGRHFVVSRQELDYKAPAYYGDVLEIFTKVNKISAVRIDLGHEIKDQKQNLVVAARTVLAFIDTDFKPRKIPEDAAGKLLISQSTVF